MLKLAHSLKYDDGKEVVLNVAGDGPLKEQLMAECNQLKLQEIVHFHGNVSIEKLRALADDSDIFILPSYKETFGISYIEAMSRGLPIIYTRGEGIDGFFPEGVVGYSTNPDDVDEMTDKIELILKNYPKMSNNCIEESKRFNWHDIATEYSHLYEYVKDREIVKMIVPMLDLSEQYSTIKDDILTKLDEVMSSSQFILGSHVKQLEENIAEMSETKHGIGVGNGSDAIHIALQAAGVQEGDEVITTAFTFFATAGAIVRAHAIPVFVDIDPVTFNIDASKIEKAITEKTKAILPVHLIRTNGRDGSDYEIAKKYNLHVIEDAAQAIGATYNGKQVGELS